MMGNIQAIEVQILQEVVQYWGWFLVFGIGLLALGIAAEVRSVLATVATMLARNATTTKQMMNFPAMPSAPNR
jgi:hypothetical protein